MGIPDIVFSKVDATLVETSLTDIDASPEIRLDSGSHNVTFSVVNTGQILTDFALLAKPHADGAYVSVITGTDWVTTDANSSAKVWHDGALNTLASGATAGASVNVGAAYSIKFQAKVGSSTTSIVIKGTVSN